LPLIAINAAADTAAAFKAEAELAKRGGVWKALDIVR
jgi:hypothetical protein